MGFHIDCKEDIHLPALDSCPTEVQREFRDALKELKSASINEIRWASFDFLSKVDGYSQYQIEASNNGTKYVILFEIKQTPLGQQNRIRILTIGKDDDVVN